MNRMFQELRFGGAPAVTHPSTDRFPTMKIDSKDFYGEPENWNTLSRVHHAQLSALGCVNALKATGDEDIKIGSCGFDEDDYEPREAASGASNMGFAYNNVQRSSVRDPSGDRVARQGVVEARTALPRKRPQGAMSTYRRFLHYENGTWRTPQEIPSAS